MSRRFLDRFVRGFRRARHTAVACLLVLASSPLRSQCPDGTPLPCGPVVPQLKRIQVLAFETGSDTTMSHVASALTDDVVASLRSSGGLAVLTSGAARARADFVLSGRVSGTEEEFVVSARLERVSTRRIAWTTRLARLRRMLPGTAAELSAGVLQAVGLRALPPRPTREVDPQAYDLVLRARYQMSRRTEPTLTRAAALLRRAIELDSASALGWVWLARWYYYSRLWGFSIPGAPSSDSALTLEVAAADRAEELDPASPAVWMVRGQVAMDVAPGSRNAAIAALRRAVTLDAGLAPAWRLLGMALEEAADTTGALAAFRRAASLAPDDGESLFLLAMHYIWLRDYALAARWADSAVAMDPTLPIARAAAGQVAYWQGRLGEADAHSVALARLARADIIGFALDVRLRLARGDTAGARAAQDSTRRRAGHSPSLHSAVAIADGFTALGDTAAAIAALEAFSVPADCHFQLHLRLERGLDPLRTMPRFRRLLVAPQVPP
jgi:tetratricopeptide (TPR) repeat protein